MRVVSLLPAATEIVYALGFLENLVAVSHDCDYPPEIDQKPQITHCEIHEAGLASGEVDRWVSSTLAEQGTLYTINEPLLRHLSPDVILTQKLCDVCAPSYGSVAHLASTLDSLPRVVNLEPSGLADVFENIRMVGEVLGAPQRAEILVGSLEKRVAAVRERALLGDPVRCVLLEWLDPLYCSGHWVPELVELAGGMDPLGRRGMDSVRVAWERVVEAEPEVLVLACCGNSVEWTLSEMQHLLKKDEWESLPAVKRGNVYVVDGSSYFSRPGPRIVDSLEILAGVLHPEIFPDWAAQVRPSEIVTHVAGTPVASFVAE